MKFVITRIILHLCLVSADALPQFFKQAVSCYGNTHDQLIEAACEYPRIIAVRNMWATTKFKTTGCPQNILAGMTYNETCCHIETSCHMIADALPQFFKQAVSCYGNTHDQLIEAACEYPRIIAVRNMWATTKFKTTGCPQNILAGMTYNETCCHIETGDCKLPFDKTKRTPYLECTGKIECSVGTDWQQMVHVCGSLFLENSNIQSMDYNCIRSSSIMNFDEVATQTEVVESYISNQGFPSKLTSAAAGTCFVTSCSSGIVVGLIDLRLTASGGQCGQKLTIKDGGTTTDISCDNNNNLTWTKVYTSVTSSIYITFTVNSVTPEAYIWIDVGGDNIDAYCGITDSFTPSSGPVCTTTTTATTTTITASPSTTDGNTTTTQPASTTMNQNVTSTEVITEAVDSSIKANIGADSVSSPTIQSISIAALVFGVVATIVLIIYILHQALKQRKNKNAVQPAETRGEGYERCTHGVTLPNQTMNQTQGAESGVRRKKTKQKKHKKKERQTEDKVTEQKDDDDDGEPTMTHEELVN